MEIRNYVLSVGRHFSQKNGRAVTELLALPLKSSKVSSKLVEGLSTESIRQITNSLPDQNFALIVCQRLSALSSLCSGDILSAYRHVHVQYNAAVDYFSSNDEDVSWFIPVLARISNDLRIAAQNADHFQNDLENTLLRESLQSLTKGWTLVARDRSPLTPTSKKLALFAVTNVLFKIYFSLNTLSLCMKLINVVEGPASGEIRNKLKLFPVCDVVTYKYYNGRLKMFEDKFEEARECLRFALRYCPKVCVKNRQQILISLVPVEMTLGVLPTRLVGDRYGLPELFALGEAERVGNLRVYNQLLQTHQRSFVRIGVYLVLEQAAAITQRCLFKRIAMLTDTTRVNLINVEAALKWLGEDVDLDEIECLLANQIFQGRVKGYLSHQKRFLVISKADPFPTNAVIKKMTPVTL